MGKEEKNIGKTGPGRRGGLAEVQSLMLEKLTPAQEHQHSRVDASGMFLEVLHTFNSM